MPPLKIFKTFFSTTTLLPIDGRWGFAPGPQRPSFNEDLPWSIPFIAQINFLRSTGTAELVQTVEVTYFGQRRRRSPVLR